MSRTKIVESYSWLLEQHHLALQGKLPGWGWQVKRCKYCYKPFTVTPLNHNMCGDACRRLFRNQILKRSDKACPWCFEDDCPVHARELSGREIWDRTRQPKVKRWKTHNGKDKDNADGYYKPYIEGDYK